MVKLKHTHMQKTAVINITFSFKIPPLVAANMAWQCPEIYLKISKGATQTAVTGFRSVSPVTQPPPPPQSHSMKGSSDLRGNTLHSDTSSTPLSGTWMLELRSSCHCIFQTRSLTAENKTGLWWLKSFQTWLLASTCFTTTKIKSDHQWRHLLLHNWNQIKPL